MCVEASNSQIAPSNGRCYEIYCQGHVRKYTAVIASCSRFTFVNMFSFLHFEWFRYKMNKAVDVPAITKMMAEFEKENMKTEIMQEIMGDTLDDALADESNEEAEEQIVNQVLDEIGKSPRRTGGKMFPSFLTITLQVFRLVKSFPRLPWDRRLLRRLQVMGKLQLQRKRKIQH
jgi:hypothetical protein